MSGAVDAQIGVAFQAMAAGEWASARDGFTAALDSAEVPEALLGLANACYWLIDLLGQAEIALGCAGDAARRARALIELGSANACELIVGHGRRLLGLAMAVSDRSAAAAAAYAELEAALTAFSRAEVPYRAAQTRLAIGHLLRDSQVDVAAAEARAALTVFEDLGAGRDANAAAALLRDLGVKAARARPRNIGRLTQREHEVLLLLAEGLSNPEIAERL